MLSYKDRLLVILEQVFCTVEPITRDDIFDVANILISNGVIVPPCKTGDVVYILRSSDSKVVDEYTVKFFYCSSKGINRIYCESENSKKNFRPRDIGKTVFLTKENAERAIKEGADNG